MAAIYRTGETDIYQGVNVVCVKTGTNNSYFRPKDMKESDADREFNQLVIEEHNQLMKKLCTQAVGSAARS